MSDNTFKTTAKIVAAIGLIAFAAHYYLKASKRSRLQVIHVDTSRISNIKDERVINSLFRMACKAFASSKLEPMTSSEQIFEQ